jgi:hypothetical protein
LRLNALDFATNDIARQLEAATLRERNRRRRNLCLAALFLAALAVNLAFAVRQVAHEFRPPACRPIVPPAELQIPTKPTATPKGTLI